MPDSSRYLAIGEIYREHGIEGAVKVYVYNQDASNFRKGLKVLIRNANGQEQEVQVLQANPYQRWFLTRFSFLKNPEEAKQWRKAVVYIDRRDLAPAQANEYYVNDLMDFTVVDEKGTIVGQLVGLQGGSTVDLWVIKNDEGHNFLIPAVPDWILKIDSAQKKVWVRLPEGLIESQKPQS